MTSIQLALLDSSNIRNWLSSSDTIRVAKSLIKPGPTTSFVLITNETFTCNFDSFRSSIAFVVGLLSSNTFYLVCVKVFVMGSKALLNHNDDPV